MRRSMLYNFHVSSARRRASQLRFRVLIGWLQDLFSNTAIWKNECRHLHHRRLEFTVNSIQQWIRDACDANDVTRFFKWLTVLLNKSWSQPVLTLELKFYL